MSIVEAFAELDQPPAERHRLKLLVEVALFCSVLNVKYPRINSVGDLERSFLVVEIAAATCFIVTMMLTAYKVTYVENHVRTVRRYISAQKMEQCSGE